MIKLTPIIQEIRISKGKIKLRSYEESTWSGFRKLMKDDNPNLIDWSLFENLLDGGIGGIRMFRHGITIFIYPSWIDTYHNIVHILVESLAKNGIPAEIRKDKTGEIKLWVPIRYVEDIKD